ncbi:MAG: MerR family transcriptional regulator, partial [Usitatibacteraceae bacterium]
MPASNRPGSVSVSLRIGELARLTGRSVHTIRWYETQGLMPGIKRDSAGRRVYREQHVGWLELMHRLRRTGMSIAAMREYTALVVDGKGTLKQRRARLAEHRENVERHVAELSQSVRLLDRKLKFYDEWIESGKQP